MSTGQRYERIDVDRLQTIAEIMGEPAERTVFFFALACTGCGRIQEYKDVFHKRLTVEECLQAAGLACLKEMPVMTLPRSEWVRREYSDKARKPLLEDLIPGIRATDLAFGHPSDPNPPTERMVAGMEDGRLLVAVGFVEDQVVAMGQAIGTPRVRELAGDRKSVV